MNFFNRNRNLLSLFFIFFFALIGLPQSDIKLILPVGHVSKITSAEYSHDGTYVITTSEDRTIKVWDSRTGRLIHDLHGHSHIIVKAVWSQDNSKILTISLDKSAKIWDAYS